MTPPKQTGPRMNDQIRASKVLLIDEQGEKKGPIAIDEAIGIAAGASLDLVEVAGGDIPVCKVMDYGKFKYQQQKKKAEAKKKQKVVEVKEIKMRPNIDIHDYEVKTRAMRRFFEEGDKVKVTLRFRGREMAHQERGMELLNKVREEFEGTTKVEALPKLEGRQMMMVLAPR
ncbi:translation initiation factor IF-3 [Parvularcula sp. LCG005]|uniref:translation initiation factor IF-3 n=1 Tax=Parvularcula sp. LCG005 TaxID=3078805 RepID=UPI00294308E8|nr:translation initiation factor IF-3 [Parvularcula sp. LCG005]WOI53660.1 translation initiation factor IF-3 [Parvularcula sp. LCG005]